MTYKKAPSIKYLNLLKQIKQGKTEKQRQVDFMLSNIGPRGREELDKAIKAYYKL